MDAVTRGKPLKNVFVDAEKIRLFSEAFGVSLREIAKRMGCDHAYLLRIMGRRQQISARYMTRLIEVLQDLARTGSLSSFAFVREVALPPPLPQSSVPQTTPAPTSIEIVA